MFIIYIINLINSRAGLGFGDPFLGRLTIICQKSFRESETKIRKLGSGVSLATLAITSLTGSTNAGADVGNFYKSKVIGGVIGFPPGGGPTFTWDF